VDPTGARRKKEKEGRLSLPRDNSKRLQQRYTLREKLGWSISEKRATRIKKVAIVNCGEAVLG